MVFGFDGSGSGLAVSSELPSEDRVGILKGIDLVTGATGMQGGSVVPFLFEDGGFRICAVTRKTDSPKGIGSCVL